MVHEVEDPLNILSSLPVKRIQVNGKVLTAITVMGGILAFIFLHDEKQGVMAPAIHEGDSLPMMHSTGISSLISDSGVVRYKLVAEDWDIYAPSNTWKFYKGLFLERFDDNMHIDLYAEADTAFFYEQRLWELRGRVSVRNLQGTLFQTEELYYDTQRREFWNHCYMQITTPDSRLEGTEFHSNEQMTNYTILNSAGYQPAGDLDREPETPPAEMLETGESE